MVWIFGRSGHGGGTHGGRRGPAGSHGLSAGGTGGGSPGSLGDGGSALQSALGGGQAAPTGGGGGGVRAGAGAAHPINDDTRAPASDRVSRLLQNMELSSGN